MHGMASKNILMLECQVVCYFLKNAKFGCVRGVEILAMNKTGPETFSLGRLLL